MQQSALQSLGFLFFITHCGALSPFFFLSLHPSVSPTMSLGITTDPCLSMPLSRLTAKLQLRASCVCLRWHTATAALGLGSGRRRRHTWGSQGLLRCLTH